MIIQKKVNEFFNLSKYQNTYTKLFIYLWLNVRNMHRYFTSEFLENANVNTWYFPEFTDLWEKRYEKLELETTRSIDLSPLTFSCSWLNAAKFLYTCLRQQFVKFQKYNIFKKYTNFNEKWGKKMKKKKSIFYCFSLKDNLIFVTITRHFILSLHNYKKKLFNYYKRASCFQNTMLCIIFVCLFVIRIKFQIFFPSNYLFFFFYILTSIYGYVRNKWHV